MKELNRLQQLCENANKRYKAGLNDDDQVKKIFDFAKKNICVCVAIGYDTYNAIAADQVLELYKINPGAEVTKEKDFVYIKMNYNNYQISINLLN